MRCTFFSLLAAGVIACTGCDDMQLDPPSDTEAPPVVDPGPPVDAPPPGELPPPSEAPPPAVPSTGDTGTVPGDVPGARGGDPNVTAPSEQPDPTNTGLNERDAVENPPPLPTDQEATGEGFDVTAEIRQKITSTEGMSINARNVKIVTEGTRVTLRGPVQDEAEKQSIDRIAQEVAGDRFTVVNNLEVQDRVR